jgi:hypothetical protein
MKHRPTTKRGRTTKSVLHLLDLEHTKSAVLKSLSTPDAQRGDIATRSMNSLTGIPQNRVWRRRFPPLAVQGAIFGGNKAGQSRDRA